MATDVVFTIFLIFAGAAVFATIFLFARQMMLVAYIALGLLIGPYGLGLLSNVVAVTQIAQIGIIFLLFLLGLNLTPQKLVHLLQKTAIVTGLTSFTFAAGGVAIGYVLGFTVIETLLIGAALMFSSTIIGLKLLPTTVLHHQITGELMISILLLQDLIAILILLLIELQAGGHVDIWEIIQLIVGLPVLVGFALGFQRYVLSPLFSRFDQIQEYVFLLVIGWCLSMVELAVFLGLSHETGAFIAGVATASSPIAPYVAEVLKPLRDFFLVIFFFTIGASFNWIVLPNILLPVLVLTAFVMVSKPWMFRIMLLRIGEKPVRSREVGIRLANISEFSLLIAVLALSAGIISAEASYVIQATTLMTFIVSSYWIVMTCPSPLAVKDELRQL